ncbi:anti-sigma-factor antagonist [Luminiphilus syltensis NOR5-1B]|uniref:Anti-sigma-factor antagonist n=1 Tax=Luminiphilus syltensis NOR5-1B TaxID=565045 RepID=B8KXM0_9GAMM|nr:STAS domain-containing protein [Luminiphilus syltensis]EED34695.1 anti-sigma-factor antagonist [Luminiphilus syltensis NOR5-1B]
MSDCRIRAASDGGDYLLRLEGDVRLTMCTALDEYFQQITADPDFSSVCVDLTRATGLDSTTLGMLAQLALKTKDCFGVRPVMYSNNPGIDRLLQSMGFGVLFSLQQDSPGAAAFDQDLAELGSSESEVKEKVIEAHRALMSISDDNTERFRDLVQTLESD